MRSQLVSLEDGVRPIGEMVNLVPPVLVPIEDLRGEKESVGEFFLAVGPHNRSKRNGIVPWCLVLVIKLDDIASFHDHGFLCFSDHYVFCIVFVVIEFIVYYVIDVAL